MDNKFIIIIPVYNAEIYIEKCMLSILNQNYDNFEIGVVDGGSTDNTFEILKKLKENYQFELIQNDVNISSPLSNYLLGVDTFSKDKEDILVTVDGDDFLAHNGVLSLLNDVYQDENIWLTYGQYEPLSRTYFNYCRPIPDTRIYRRSGQWYASHLRTVKKKLLDKVKREDMINENGIYYRYACDAAYMFPIIEMSGQKHMKFIKEVLYYYNDVTPNNAMKTDTMILLKTDKIIRDKPIYNELTEL
jgi:glycosyltransferase involved in cell wall biosynthesis